MMIDLNAPCMFCGYNGPLYWQAGSHEHDCPFLKVGGGLERQEILPTIISQQYQEIKLMRQIIESRED